MLDSIAARYHWTLDYILWGVSWLNLQLILKDSTTHDYQSDKKGGAEVINCSDPKVLKNSLKDFGL